MRRLMFSVSLVLVFGAFVAPTPGYAQQSLNIYLGGFVPRGEADRVKGDVLFHDQSFFQFNLDRFRSGTIGAEWLVALTNNVEVGLGAGIYSKDVPSRYAFLVNANGSDITQRLKMRIAPVSATFRLLPFGRNAPVQPYIGGGVVALSWRYTETGDFVDLSNNVFHDRFEGSGTATGPLVLGGIRVPVGAGDIGFEIRHQSGEGNINSYDFAGASKIDLGGMNYLATFNIRF